MVSVFKSSAVIPGPGMRAARPKVKMYKPSVDGLNMMISFEIFHDFRLFFGVKMISLFLFFDDLGYKFINII